MTLNFTQAEILPNLRLFVNSCFLNDSALRDQVKNQIIFKFSPEVQNKIFENPTEAAKIIATVTADSSHLVLQNLEQGICLGLSCLWIIAKIFDSYPQGTELQINSLWLQHTMQLIYSLNLERLADLTDQEKINIGLFYTYCCFFQELATISQWTQSRNPKLRNESELQIVQSYPFLEENLEQNLEILCAKLKLLQEITAITGSHNHAVAFTIKKTGNDEYNIAFYNPSKVEDGNTAENLSIRQLYHRIRIGSSPNWAAIGYPLTIVFIEHSSCLSRYDYPSIADLCKMPSRPSLVRVSNNSNWTPITAAANIGNLEALQHYFNLLGENDFCNEFLEQSINNIALQKIIVNGHFACFEYVWKQFSNNPQQQSEFIINSMYYAVLLDNLEFIRYILSQSNSLSLIDRVPKEGKISPLGLAVRQKKGAYKCIKEYIEEKSADNTGLSRWTWAGIILAPLGIGLGILAIRFIIWPLIKRFTYSETEKSSVTKSSAAGPPVPPVGSLLLDDETGTASSTYVPPTGGAPTLEHRDKT